MNCYIRDINPRKEEEIELVVKRAMDTVIETIPEFDGRTENALKIWPNFTFEKMKAMFVQNYGNPLHRTFVVLDEQSNLP